MKPRDETAVLRTLRARAGALGLEGRSLLVAVSGGLDSTALLHGLHLLSGDLRLTLVAGHVNHGLRGAESDADEAHVAATATGLGVPFVATRVDPATLRSDRSSRARPTVQEAARRLRHDALVALAERAGAELVVTAHHADDQAETVLLRLLRGSGPDGLAGIPDRSPDGRVVRPLLVLPRAELRAHADRFALRWREDASNQDPAYARNRLRRDWLPGLAEAFNPRLLRAIVDLAEAQRRDSEWIESHAEVEASQKLVPCGDELQIADTGWGEMPEALARRLVRRALVQQGASRYVSRVHLERMLRFLREGRTGTSIELPGGLTLRREPGAFRLAARREVPDSAC